MYPLYRVELDSTSKSDLETLREINKVSWRYVETMNSKFWDDKYCLFPEIRPLLVLLEKLSGSFNKKKEVISASMDGK